MAARKHIHCGWLSPLVVTLVGCLGAADVASGPRSPAAPIVQPEPEPQLPWDSGVKAPDAGHPAPRDAGRPAVSDAGISRDAGHPPAADAGSWDLLDFMRNTSAYPTLLDSRGWMISFHEEPGRFFYVKSSDGRSFERYGYNQQFIYLERDTSWNAFGNDSYDALPYGSLTWGKRQWEPNGVLTFQTTIAGFNSRRSGTLCRYDWEQRFLYFWPSTEPSATKIARFVPKKAWGGDLGNVDSIGLEYNNGTEVHWYARGYGWVSWEYKGPPSPDLATITWNRFSKTKVLPNDGCTELGSFAAPFRDTSTMRGNTTSWDGCFGQATCAPGETLLGLSVEPQGQARVALCNQGSPSLFTGVQAAVLTLDAKADARRALRTAGGNTDWANGFLKLECGANEYVSGVSEGSTQCGGGGNRFHGIRCAVGGPALGQTCSTRVFDNGDNRGDHLLSAATSQQAAATGDWDPDAFKGSCALDEYLAGVSVHPISGAPHSLLCCR